MMMLQVPTEEAELVGQLKLLSSQLEACTCRTLRDSLYRLSREIHAHAADQGGTLRIAPTDRVMANLLFNSI